MNIVIISGTIVSNINFKFIYNRYRKKSKYTSIASFYIELENASIIKIYGYDNMADFMYKNCKFGNKVICDRIIDNDGNVAIKEAEKLEH